MNTNTAIDEYKYEYKYKSFPLYSNMNRSTSVLFFTRYIQTWGNPFFNLLHTEHFM
jgi:hypothetical protein